VLEQVGERVVGPVQILDAGQRRGAGETAVHAVARVELLRSATVVIVRLKDSRDP
jgi:hypothetical protein